MAFSTELPERNYPDGCPEIVGIGDPVAELNARHFILGSVNWFDENPEANPTKHPEYVGLADFKPDKIGDDDLVTRMTELQQKYSISITVLAFCLKHVFLIVRHGFDTYVKMMIEQRGENEKLTENE